MGLNNKEAKIKNRKLADIYFIILITLALLVSFMNIWTAYGVGETRGLTFKQVIALHKSAEIDRIYQGYEVLIIQRLGAAVLYFLLGILAITIYFLFMEKLISKARESTKNKKG